uniref:Elongation factor-1, delta, b n=1 Tax=Nothobranchius rachovii TaxID=451742 RepID=A0A1A8R8C3_9TELE
MSKKIPQSSVKDPSEQDQPPSRCQVDPSFKASLSSRKKTEPGQKNGETTSSSPENGSLNGDGKRSGKSRRRRRRSSNPGSRPEGNMEEVKPDERTSRAALMGLQSECGNVWFERNLYERAESLYQSWLGSSGDKTPHKNPSHQSSGKRSATVAPSSSGLTCHHGGQVACHHVVHTVWVNKATFDQAESHFVEESAQPSIPNSLDLPSLASRSAASRTPDEGYQSLAQTPATPITQQAAATPTPRQSVNGLPRIPVELLREVWLDKPQYDRAEAAFYQNLYGNNSFKRPSCTSTTRSNEHPQSLVEEEEEEEETQVRKEGGSSETKPQTAET